MQFHLEKSLLDYLIAADGLQKDTVLANPRYVELFQDIDQHWRTEILQGELDVDPFAAFLLGQSYFLWLATVRSALSGHGTAVFPILRASLESACYGYLLAHDPSARRCWLDRDDSPEHLKRFRRRFNQGVADAAKLIGVDHAWVAQSITSMYDGAIMFGAHPNPRFLLNHVGLGERSGNRAELILTCLNAVDSDNTHCALSASVEAGLTVSTVNALSFAEHPRGASVVAGLHAIQAKMDQVFAITR